jgi:parvulin-like peptidyl-prolyl isomerase
LDRASFVKNTENPEVVLPDEVAASHILISYKGADRADAKIKRGKQAAKKEAERIRNLILNDGKDFADMAKQHSDGPSGPKGGDLGKFKFEVMAKPFSEAAFALEVGEVSEVVETGFGFHVIKRTE